MTKFIQITDQLRAAADIEAETPITVGTTTVGAERQKVVETERLRAALAELVPAAELGE
jgi:hypothetical protein